MKDERDMAGLERELKKRLSGMMQEAYRDMAILGYDSTEVRLVATRLFLDRSVELCWDEHQKRVNPNRTLKRLVSLVEGLVAAGARASAPVSVAGGDVAERGPSSGKSGAM